MSDVPREAAGGSERRVLRWLLGGQVVIAILLVAVDLGPSIPDAWRDSPAPALDMPTRPGDQTRRYPPTRPGSPLPGGGADMPRRLTSSNATIADRPALRLRGVIAPGDGARVAAEIARSRVELIALDSPGGSVSDALEIGRAIRDKTAETRLEAETICLSACPYAFAGGVERRVDPDARLGVHQHSFGESTILPTFLAAEDIQRGQSAVLAHLDTMGIDLRIMGPAMATPADEIYILTIDELSDWNVVTE